MLIFKSSKNFEYLRITGRIFFSNGIYFRIKRDKKEPSGPLQFG